MFRNGNVVYLPVWPDEELSLAVIKDAAAEAGLDVKELPDGLRIRQLGDLKFAMNYGERVDMADLEIVSENAHFLHGSPEIGCTGVAIWREKM